MNPAVENDVQEVRRMLAPANPCPPGGLSGAARDAAGEAAYARVTASGTSTGAESRRAARSRRGVPSRRATVRLVAVGGLAVAVAAGVTVVQGAGGVDKDGKPRPVVPGLPAGGGVANAQEVLTKAADAAQARPFTAPRPGQWIYTETRYRRSPMPGPGKVIKPGTPLKTVVDRMWMREDGTRMGLYERGKLVTTATGGGFPPVDYPSVSKLPRDPDRMLAWARGTEAPLEGGPDAWAFAALSSLLLNNAVIPPAQTAAAYKALAKIPGVTLDKKAVDDQGHRVLSVSRVAEGWVRNAVLLDPSTYAYRGHRATVVKDHKFEEGGAFKKGATESIGVRLAYGIVDRPGQRP
ncbi:CU044_5270 family protein [Actinomadura rubrisoli]|uniref:CU044_5270 family protein n=1 Tax=Actinomadura rubrisoli TaxID=2530368 RepID=A0A4V2YZ20_9ACTN|nr:CU044_5270 family protein [Actinomadura rubrisoli]TDD95457.1 hypothetical protein E1298_04960 [Actinomadura rubrisoli]